MSKERLISYLEKGKNVGDTWERIAAKFGFTAESARSIWRRHRKTSPSIGNNSFTEDLKEGKAELTTELLTQITSLEDLIVKCKIDTSIWEVERYVQNFWGNSDIPRWQVKAWLAKKKVNTNELLVDVLKNYKSNYIPLKEEDILQNNNSNKPVSIFLSLADPHIDKQTLDGKSMAVKIADYLHIMDMLIYRAYRAHKIEEIVYVLGNDYFTSDNYTPATTNQTPQSVTNEYTESYEKGFDMAVIAINKLRQFCQTLKVIFVPANHDRTKSFCMLHALEIYFRADKNIIFDRTADNSKVHVYGETMIAMHHGDTVEKDMPVYMASKYRKEWGSTSYTEIALADKHHKKEWKLKLVGEEEKSTRMFISPSLSSADVYHKDKNHDLTILAGTIRIYDKEKGFIGELEERIKK